MQPVEQRQIPLTLDHHRHVAACGLPPPADGREQRGHALVVGVTLLPPAEQVVGEHVTVTHLAEHGSQPPQVVLHVAEPDRVHQGAERPEVGPQTSRGDTRLVDRLRWEVTRIRPQPVVVVQEAAQ